MNVLFVTYDFPYPTTSGGKNRAYHLLKYAAQQVNITLFSFVREDYNPDSNEEIKKMGVGKIVVSKRRKLASLSNIPSTIFQNRSIFKTLYYEKSTFEKLKEIIREEEIDLVHFESSYTGFYIGRELKKLGVKIVLGTENIEHILYYDYANNLKRFYLKPFVNYQAGRLKVEEVQMMNGADRVTVITEDEKEILSKSFGIDSDIVANGIEPNNFSYEFERKIRGNILFVGNFSYFPNTDAFEFFYKEVFPKLDSKLQVTVIGKQVSEKFKNTDKRIIKKDFVPDIISEYRSADILVFPIRIGGGTNFKVLEAMSLGVPIVANPARLSGLQAKSEEHFLPAVSADEYVSQIGRLMDDSSLRQKLTVNARKLIEDYYAWDKIGKELIRIWKSQ